MRTHISAALALGLVASACGDFWGERDSHWGLPAEGEAGTAESLGLTGSVAIYDQPRDRLVLLSADGNLGLDRTTIRVGKNMATMAPSRDRGELYVLSRGVQPRTQPDDELPSLTVIDGGSKPKVLTRYELTDPLGGIAVDPLGEWVVVYDAGGIVVNPNELILIKVDDPGAPPVSKTIRSFGGRPTRISFTDEVLLPRGAPRRLLVVETGQDVTVLDLSNLERDEVTILMPNTQSGVPARPAEVAVSEGDPQNPDDTRLAIRLESQSDVMIAELAPPAPGIEDKDFEITINVADVGGVPSAIDFVNTDGGLRLAALVPQTQDAALIDPATTIVETVDLPGGYSRLTRVTDQVLERPDGGGDVALLWGGSSASSIAFWSLGRTSGRPYRSVEAYPIGINVSDVRDVPGNELGHRKILVNPGSNEFYVLDLNERTSFPMLTRSTGFELTVAPDGGRAWAVRTGTAEMAQIDLDTLHPTSVTVERDVTAAHDIERRDGGRALVAIHGVGALGATVLDALQPDTAETRFHPGLLLGGE